MTANTIALIIRVPREGTQESKHFFVFVKEKKKELNYLLVQLLSKYHCSV